MADSVSTMPDSISTMADSVSSMADDGFSIAFSSTGIEVGAGGCAKCHSAIEEPEIDIPNRQQTSAIR